MASSSAQEGRVYLAGYIGNGDTGRLEEEHLSQNPWYTHDYYLEIYAYDGQVKPTRVDDDEDPRKILKIAKTASRTKLKISLETPSKSFAVWTFKDVCEAHSLSEASYMR